MTSEFLQDAKKVLFRGSRLNSYGPRIKSWNWFPKFMSYERFKARFWGSRLDRILRPIDVTSANNCLGSSFHSNTKIDMCLPEASSQGIRSHPQPMIHRVFSGKIRASAP